MSNFSGKRIVIHTSFLHCLSLVFKYNPYTRCLKKKLNSFQTRDKLFCCWINNIMLRRIIKIENIILPAFYLRSCVKVKPFNLPPNRYLLHYVGIDEQINRETAQLIFLTFVANYIQVNASMVNNVNKFL